MSVTIRWRSGGEKRNRQGDKESAAKTRYVIHMLRILRNNTNYCFSVLQGAALPYLVKERCGTLDIKEPSLRSQADELRPMIQVVARTVENLVEMPQGNLALCVDILLHGRQLVRSLHRDGSNWPCVRALLLVVRER